MPLAWSYARTSTTRQAGADKSGMERQSAALSQWLAEHPEYVLQEALVDAGVSAGKGKNRRTGALARFIEGGRSGSVPRGSCLVVESMSRFSREIATTTLRTLLNDVWGAGLAISFCTDGVVLDEELIARQDHRLHAILGAIGQARREWEERSRRSKGAAEKARRLQDEGIRTGGPTPWWIERDEEGRLVLEADGSLRLDRAAVATIQLAVDLAIGGMGTTLIAARLNDEGLPPPPTAGNRSQYGQASSGWTHGRVSNLLRHPALVGTLQRKGAPPIPGYYPEILTAEQWGRLRAALEQRDKLRGRLRGGSQQTRNLFQTVARCSVCGGPFSYHRPSARARADHPGWAGCREGNCREGRRCNNRGYIAYDQLESHCLTRLALTDWEALLRQPEDDQDRHQLEEQVAQLSGDHARLGAQLESAELRAEALWEEDALSERQATAERVIRRLRAQLAQVKEQLAEAEQRLAVIRSRPSAPEAAAELVGRVRAFWDDLPTATPAERLAFNRWLLAQGIEFRVHRLPAGAEKSDRPIELVVGGESAGIEPLAGTARRIARDLGLVAPAAAIEAGDLVFLEGRGIEGAIRAALEPLPDGRRVDHTKTFDLWRDSAPIRPLVEGLLALLPQKLESMGIQLEDPQQVMRLAIVLAMQVANHRRQQLLALLDGERRGGHDAGTTCSPAP
jgi:hypothetical protein